MNLMNRLFSLIILSIFACPSMVMGQDDSDSETLREVFRSAAYNDIHIASKIANFTEMVEAASEERETFLFMTDPHLMGSGSAFTTAHQTTFKKYIGSMLNYYENAPLNLAICGGDWLNQKDTHEAACSKLTYVDQTMRTLFSPYLPVMGNHDTNYIGTTVDGVRSLNAQEAAEIMFHDEGAAYYRFVADNTAFYVLDTWTALTAGSTPTDQTDYYNDQTKWLAEQLLEHDDPHAVIVLHAYYRSDVQTGTKHTLAQYAAALANAYNQRTKRTIKKTTYDFANCKGMVHCFIAGHCHEDALVTSETIPVMLTTSMQSSNIPTFDLCLLDYGNGTLCTVRAGSGSDRVLPLKMDSEKFATVSVSAAGGRTFCSDSPLDFSKVPGLKAYIVIGVTDGDVQKVVLKQVVSVPENTGVLIFADEGKYNIPMIEQSETDVSENKLVGTLVDKDVEPSVYVLLNENDSFGFYRTTSNFTVGAHTAYLDSSVSDIILPESGNVKTMSLDEMTPTSVSQIKSESGCHNNIVYDLNGMIMPYIGKCVKIVDGKKILER